MILNKLFKGRKKKRYTWKISDIKAHTKSFTFC